MKREFEPHNLISIKNLSTSEYLLLIKCLNIVANSQMKEFKVSLLGKTLTFNKKDILELLYQLI